MLLQEKNIKFGFEHILFHVSPSTEVELHCTIFFFSEAQTHGGMVLSPQDVKLMKL